MKVAPAIFIVGHPRSGTSLLRALLDGHPDLVVLPFETHLFDWANSSDPVAGLLDRTRLWPTLHRHRPSISRDEVTNVLTQAFAQASDPRTRLISLVEGWRQLTGARTGTRWVEKTPRHLYETPTLLRWFGSDARILVMRRDPRDVMASDLKQKASRTIFQMALTARLAHQTASEHEQDPRVRIIPYEGLVRDPEHTMRGVCRFLDVVFDSAVVTPTVLGADYSGNSRFASEIRGVSEAAIGRYHEILGGPRLARAEALLAPVLSGGGYTEAPSDSVGSNPLPMRRFLPSRAAITLIVRSRLWRSRALRSVFGGG